MAAPTAGYPKKTGTDQDGSVMECFWTLTTADPKGDAVQIPEWMDRTWHFKGTIGTAHVKVETAPTDTDADFAETKNAAGGATIDITALPAVVTPIENSRFARPRLNTAGAGATVTAHVICRRSNNMRQ